MSYSPLQINTLGALLQQSGLEINAEALAYMGTSTALNNYTPGSVVGTTCLFALSNAIRLAYTIRGNNPTTNVSPMIYDNLISIGSSNIAALGDSKPSTYDLTYENETTSYGWLRLPALLAYQEFYVNNGSYEDFLHTFNICESKKNQLNFTIQSLYNSVSYLDGVFSNMNDLISADITGVSLSTFYWGQDLIASGRAIDLSRIDVFGNPQALLQNIYKNQALTKALSLALLSAGFTSTDIQQFCAGVEATPDQQKLIYASFTVVVGQDLNDICVPLNCQTPNLSSLADLLNPKKLFPNSYTSLTYPLYNSIPLPTNSKTYYLIYTGGEVNMKNDITIGKRLYNIIPTDIAFAADAFSVAMMQIKNIQTTSIEKFSQVVRNLENTNGLTGVNGTSTPTNKTAANAGIAALAKGTGPDGTYTSCNFFGSMTNIYYNWKELKDLINLCATPQLATIYINMNNLLSGPGPYNTALQNLIDDATDEINSIYATNAANANKLIALYNEFGTKYKAEVQARALALPNLNQLTSDNTDVITFIDNLNDYAANTESEGAALVLKDIANLDVEGGNYLLAAMREARNAQRLGLAGLGLDNDVNGTDNSNLRLPPISGQTLANDPISGYENTKGSIANVPIITGAATTPGSLAGSPETTLVPDNLSILVQPSDESVLTPEKAIETVILCNCDCWDLI
jgi:hypothetical protein